jgi:hypothetical protein
MPRGQRLAAWLDSYTDCEECGTLPQDADDAESGQLCEAELESWSTLEARDRACLVRLGLLHQQAGAMAAGAELGEDGPRLVTT